MEDEEEQWKADDPAAETSQSYQESLEGEGEESVEDVHNSPQPGTQSRFRLRSKSPSNSGRGVRFAKGGSTTNLHAGPSGSLSSTASTLSLSKQRSAPTSAKTRVAVSLQQTVKKSADDELPKNNGDDDDDELWNGSDGYGTDEFEEDVDGGDTNPSNLSIAVDVDMDEDAFERELGKSIARGGGHGSNKFRSNGSQQSSLGENVAPELSRGGSQSHQQDTLRGHARQQSTPGSHVSTGQSPYGLTASQGSLYSADFEEFDEDDSIHRSISRSRSRKPSPPKTKSTSPSHSSMYRATSGHHYKQSSARNGNSSSSSMPSATGRNGSASASEGGGKRAPPALSRHGSLSSADGGLSLADLSIDASAFHPDDNEYQKERGRASPPSKGDTRPRCPLTKRPIREPVICVVDGFTYERTAITEYLTRYGKSPVTQESAAMSDLYSTKRVVEDALREGVADHEAAKLAQQLVKGHTPELANVPLHLRKLRKAAVAALHKFNTKEAIAKQKQLQTNEKREGEGKANEGYKDGDVGEGVGSGATGEKKAVGLVLATALNDLELELLTAQRARRKQQAEERLALRDKRRRAERRRREHNERLHEAEGKLSASLVREKELEERTNALQSGLDAAAATAEALKRARDEVEKQLGVSRDEFVAAEKKIAELTVAKETDAEEARRAAEVAKEVLTEAKAALERADHRRLMELELATRAREESEKRWEARWNTLPAHHEERLEIERQRLSEDQSRAAQRAAALKVGEEELAEEGKRLREAIRDEAEAERRRAKEEASAERAHLERLRVTLEGKEQELAAREHAVRAKQDAASRSLKEEQAQVEEERAQLGRERARLAVDVELLAPRLAEMSNEQQRLEQARLLLANDREAVEADRKRVRELEASARSLASKARTAAAAAKESEMSSARSAEASARKMAAAEVLGRRNAEEQQRLHGLEGSIAGQAVELKRVMGLLQRFEKALLLQSRMTLAAASRRRGPISSAAANGSSSKENLAPASQFPLHDAAFAVALESELNDLIRQLDARMGTMRDLEHQPPRLPLPPSLTSPLEDYGLQQTSAAPAPVTEPLQLTAEATQAVLQPEPSQFEPILRDLASAASTMQQASTVASGAANASKASAVLSSLEVAASSHGSDDMLAALNELERLESVHKGSQGTEHALGTALWETSSSSSSPRRLRRTALASTRAASSQSPLSIFRPQKSAMQRLRDSLE